ncbi:MAG: FprA family A-type flavoprotein [bacterium]|nr:FprA family A-type flavoprotein [bacterium]
MNPRELKPNVYWVGAVDWDRRLFDELIPLPNGTSYNSYLIKGSDKTALVDTVDPAKTYILIDRLNQLGVKKIDYVIINHAEQDHSGSLPDILKIYPEAKVITTSKCKTMLINLLEVSEDKIISVEDRETLSLGDKTLEFIHFPWVHWPETMITYLREDKILFSCDLFGAHLATSDLFVKDETKIYESAKRYYAEIMMPFRTIIQKNLEKVESIKINIIAPSHGPMHNKPAFIIDAYKHWIFDAPQNIVVIPYLSMHNSTRKMVEYFAEALIVRGVDVKQFNLSDSDIGELAMSLVDAATVVIGVPTVLAGAHPLAVYATYLVKILRPKLRFVSLVGSYGWGGKTVEQLASIISGLEVKILDAVLCKGLPKKEDFEALDRLANSVLENHKNIINS